MLRNPASKRVLTALLAVVVLYIAVVGAPIRLAMEHAPALPADVCSALHGGTSPASPDPHHPASGRQGCVACAF